MKAEEWLKNSCLEEDWDKLTDENLSDFISTNNVLKYMEHYATFKTDIANCNRIVKELISFADEEPTLWAIFKDDNPDIVDKLIEILS